MDKQIWEEYIEIIIASLIALFVMELIITIAVYLLN